MSIDRRVSWLAVGFLTACSVSGSKGASTAGEEAANTVRVPGSSSVVSLIELPEGSRTRLSATEIPWEAYDAFVFRLDEKDPTLPPDADAVARPSQPYITMDHAFGHAGFPVISVSYLGAQAFCEWLSRKSGRRFRLPTEAEWELAARAGGEPIDLGATAWTLETSGGPKTHAIGSKLPNALGFHDLLGNAAEWCTAPDGTGVVRGGSYLDSAEGDLFALRRPYERAWNKSDPQIPKSKWWLADAPFIGFRIVCEE